MTLSYEFQVDALGGISARGDVALERIGHLRVDQRRLSWMESLRESSADLVRVALAVYHVDRLARRSERHLNQMGLQWLRNISMDVAVTETRRWAHARQQLENLLWELTGDRWRFQFRQTDAASPRQGDLFKERLPGAKEVALFSGGLDSAAGLLLYARQWQRPIYAFSAVGVPVREALIGRSLAQVRSRGVSARWICFKHQLSGPQAVENTQRTRGLLFLAIASALADAVDAPRVVTFECGPGALNVPMNSAQIGAQATRAMHPSTLLNVESFVSHVLDRKIEVRAPFLLKTKGQLCIAVGDDLTAVARVANSCDETERAKKDPFEHCGLCTSCLFRRAALHAALGRSDPTPYRNVVTTRSGRYELEAFRRQAAWFAGLPSYRALVAADPAMFRVEDYLSRVVGLSGERAGEAVVALLRRQGAEVLSFFADVEPDCAAPIRSVARQEASHDLFSSTR